MIKEIIEKIKFDNQSDRLGPDCPFSHWKLYFKSLKKTLCKKKFAEYSEGADFRAGAYAVNCSKIYLGKNVVIRPSTMLFADPRGNNGLIIIRDDVLIGSGVHIYVGNHRYDRKGVNIINQGHYPSQNVLLDEGCWIGANSIILPGVSIGKNSVVGAGSVVTKDIPDYSIACGNPAKIIKEI